MTAESCHTLAILLPLRRRTGEQCEDCSSHLAPVWPEAWHLPRVGARGGLEVVGGGGRVRDVFGV